MIRTLIVEDEPLARNLLRSYIALHGDLELVGEAANGREGMALANELCPDLLLLDIELPELSGIELARRLRSTTAVIFITAYGSHAITAFELGAFDYLLKPVLPERFAAAITRVRERTAVQTASEDVQSRLDRLAQSGALSCFFVRHLGSIVPVHTSDIVRLESDDDYTAVYANGKRLLVHLPLRDMAMRLDPNLFVRVHRCDVVNLRQVSSIVERDRRFVLTMLDGSEVVSSRAGSQTIAAHMLYRANN